MAKSSSRKTPAKPRAKTRVKTAAKMTRKAARKPGKAPVRPRVAKRAPGATKSGPQGSGPRAARWVYAFGGGKAAGRADMRNLLGGKGAGLAEMANLGLPVPPGFTITTEVCTAYY